MAFTTSIASLAQTPSAKKPAMPPANFKNSIAKVNGIDIHYVIGGKGEPLVLVHGFGQTWYMWNRLLPELSKHFTVIAPDLRGIGESSKPKNGYDKKTMATDIHALMQQLGLHKINIAGHDIGLMVVYAYAAQYPDEVKKIALIDALLPGIEPLWSEYATKAWWWNFFSWPVAPVIIKGKEKEFMTGFWDTQAYNKNAFTKNEKDEFVRAYSKPGAIQASFNWFAAFPQDAKDNQIFSKQKLTMPVLALGGDHHLGSLLPEHASMIAEDVRAGLIKDSGHWIAQEQTAQLLKALLDFFGN
ncbi:MAG: alpha/beta hydrolase [Bacteroidetes bacterium]|nr:alpha/beta hydrolase [Bacteroidota bacterium]